MEPFEKRRKTMKVAGITSVAVLVLYGLILAIYAKSTDILADSLEGVQSAEADSMTLQWVFNILRDFRVWTIIVCIIEIICICVCFYCLIEGTRPPKKKEGTVLGVPEIKSLVEENGGQMGQEDQEQTIELQVLEYIKSYSNKIVIPYAFNWLVKNDSIKGATQKAFMKFVKSNTGISISPSHMHDEYEKILSYKVNPDMNEKANQAYDRMANYFSSFIKVGQPFSLDIEIEK